MVKRSGFSLIEVLVAMTLLSVALLGVAGSALYAAQLLRQAQARERSTFEAMQVMDSLAGVRTPSSGQRSVDNIELQWVVSTMSVGPASIDLTVSYRDGSARRIMRFRSLHGYGRP